MRLLAVLPAAAALAAAAWAGAGVLEDQDDRSVNRGTPEARRAAAVAREVVPGRILGVLRDEDNGTWEVVIAQDGREYEVELAPGSLSLLRLDYDTD